MKLINESTRYKILYIAFSGLTATLILLFAAGYLMGENNTESGTEEVTAFPGFSVNGFMDGTYQNQLEAALKDHFVFHRQSISMVSGLKSRLGQIYNMADNFFRKRGRLEGLVPYGNIYRMNGTDWLTNLPYVYNQTTAEGYQRKADEINSFSRSYPHAKFYVYYCSRSEDMDWFDQSEGFTSFRWADYLKSLLDSDIRFDKLKFHTFDEFTGLMYKTDHHWRNTGARVGYDDILAMMNQDFSLGIPRSIIYTDDYAGLRWQGSRSLEAGIKLPENESDSFETDTFQLEAHEVYFGGKKQPIGMKEAYESGEVNRSLDFNQYLNFFGFESQPIKLVYPSNTGSPNLLILGDSFTRAIREQLASHFGVTVYINFRILDQVNLRQVMEENDINAVLLMGQQDAWSGWFLGNSLK